MNAELSAADRAELHRRIDAAVQRAREPCSDVLGALLDRLQFILEFGTAAMPSTKPVPAKESGSVEARP